MQSSKGSVVLEWRQGIPPRSFVFYVEDALMDVLRALPDIGAMDGNEIGTEGFRIFLYGSDADALWCAIEPTVRRFEPAPMSVTITSRESGGTGHTIEIQTP